MPGADSLAAAEALFLAARELADRLEVAHAAGRDEPGLAARSESAAARARRAAGGGTGAGLGAEDARALAAMRRWLAESPGGTAPGETAPGETAPGDTAAGDAAAGDGAAGARPDPRRALAGQIMKDYAAAESAVETGEGTLTRLAVLGRLGEEPGPGRRRRLFLALAPVWRSIAGDGGPGSPYRTLVRQHAQSWAGGGSPAGASARALGMDPAAVEPALVAILSAWRDVSAGAGPVEPWDWWYQAGAAARAVRAALPLDRLLPLTRAYHAALGADPGRLQVVFDVTARPGRPPVPVAYTTFGGRPRQPPAMVPPGMVPPGMVPPGARPWVFAAYTAGGLGELTELIHETGHAIHIAAIATRPAFADWPDSDALTEALADLLAHDTTEPGWQARWLGVSAPGQASLRARYADVVLDVCWALLEIRLHAAPERSPDEVWAELTATYLGIVAHPEWPWWAMRGQLVDAPGYMSNYAIGPIITADLRAAIRAARGDWTAGDPGWYAWVSQRVYRWGLARSSEEVLRSVLGRAPSLAPLLAEIRRAG